MIRLESSRRFQFIFAYNFSTMKFGTRKNRDMVDCNFLKMPVRSNQHTRRYNVSKSKIAVGSSLEVK